MKIIFSTGGFHFLKSLFNQHVKILLALFLFLTSLSANVFAQNASTSGIEALWYYKEEPRSRESFFKHSDKIDILGP